MRCPDVLIEVVQKACLEKDGVDLRKFWAREMPSMIEKP